MKKIVLLSIILIFLITGISFAFQNEPDGFRGLKWGDAPAEDMWLAYQMIDKYLDKGNIYDRIKENLYIGSVKFYKIEYTFNLRSNQFYKWEANFSDEINYNILKVIFEDKFGKSTYISEDKKGYLLCWEGDKTFIRIWYKPSKIFTGEGYGQLTIKSVKIHQEDLPEINKQKEIEKAKEDF